MYMALMKLYDQPQDPCEKSQQLPEKIQQHSKEAQRIQLKVLQSKHYHVKCPI